jgi:hypothetical protein
VLRATIELRQRVDPSVASSATCFCVVAESFTVTEARVPVDVMEPSGIVRRGRALEQVCALRKIHGWVESVVSVESVESLRVFEAATVWVPLGL